ncbi:hypothetical protein [Pseudobacteriovorax antillogorgiicola]|uniref:Uncharacterized protein n=1 Tax=Pseudobacteriovorax antillogorgiicola TaxID=1513793 RepID=A0A1Y6CQD0_9BACT|nr:hypothetical protein [Pseudobacteriovorax antillogorgiicola]TCS41890.1 hypothetical protein EDD56_1454 [Pseudobacteriovorax antillogorgiicola]SMF83191.1 hypothetical protein SAMN06296036_1458 [Pseudobacteriovorax antillogorgiicola]
MVSVELLVSRLQGHDDSLETASPKDFIMLRTILFAVMISFSLSLYGQSSEDEVKKLQQQITLLRLKLETKPRYEEGTWNPDLVSSVNLATPSLSVQNARWRRVGDTVFATVERIEGISVLSGGKNTYVVLSTKGLPYTDNKTEFYGTAMFDASPSYVTFSVLQNSHSSTDIFLGGSVIGNAGSLRISALHFQYEVAK